MNRLAVNNVHWSSVDGLTSVCSWTPSPHQDKIMKFRQGTKGCGSSFLSNYYIPLSYLRKTRHWSLLHFKGLFSVNLFCCYSLYVLYFLLFVYFHFFSLIFCCSYFGVRESKTVMNRVWPTSWFFGTETANQIRRIIFSVWAGFPHCCYVPASSKCKVICWRFCKYVQMWKYKLPCKKMYIKLSQEVHHGQGTKW